MAERSVTHATFVVERTYDTAPARVFNAWADPAVKARWFGGAEDAGAGEFEFELDFRVGGREVGRGSTPDGQVFTFECRYSDIVPEQRIVYTYDMYLNETRISVSVATAEFKPAGTGTRLIFTEQGAFLDGHDTPALREQGTGSLLDALGAELQRQPATTETA
jgi:uncharacterized protein YndB with AHSA1/START domain